MALFGKKLSSVQAVDNYNKLEAEVVELEKKTASAGVGGDNETLANEIKAMKVAVAAFKKNMKKSVKFAESELDDFEDMSLGRIDDSEFNEIFNGLLEERIIVDTVNDKVESLEIRVENCARYSKGEQTLPYEKDPNNLHSHDDYSRYSKAMLKSVRKNPTEVTYYESDPDTLGKVGMVSSAIVAASNPVLGSTLMVANMVASNARKNNQNKEHQEKQRGEE